MDELGGRSACGDRKLDRTNEVLLYGDQGIIDERVVYGSQTWY